MSDLPLYDCDVLIVGGGIAGLWCAFHLAPYASVVILTKGTIDIANTYWAQGGIAAALAPEDSPEKHFADTLKAGSGLCDKGAVGVLVAEAPEQVLRLWRLGVPFDTEDGKLRLAREGAHSVRRVVHAYGDATGRAIMETLLKVIGERGVSLREGATVVEVIVRDGRCVGAVAVTDGTVSVWRAKAIVLATGGLGQLFAVTTNPGGATGDGLAIALRAGATLMDMEFVQFHPTALAVGENPRPLISEAVRGEGAVLRNAKGKRFMPRYHPDAELAPRDVVARAIFQEMQETGTPHVWLDISHRGESFVKVRFPNIYRACLERGFNLGREPVPVAPAAHYHMGGIRTDLWGHTDISGLFACGECACIGAHGANRLASNSLVEGLVFGYRAAKALIKELPSLPSPPLSPKTLHPLVQKWKEALPHWREEWERLREIQGVMSELVGVVRWEEGLREAMRKLRRIGTESQGQLLFGWTSVAWLIARAALERTESRGAHFRRDFPMQDDAHWRCHLLWRTEEKASWHYCLSPTRLAVSG